MASVASEVSLDLQRWFKRVNEHVQQIQRGLYGLEEKPNTQVVVDQLHKHLINLRTILRKVRDVYVAQTGSVTPQLLNEYVGVLETLLIVANDLGSYWLMLNPNDVAPSVFTTGKKQKVQFSFAKETADFATQWVKASPFVSKAIRDLSPLVNSINSFPDAASFLQFDSDPEPIKQLRRKSLLLFTQDITRLEKSQNDAEWSVLGLRLETKHLLGINFLVSQLQLFEKGLLEVHINRQISNWYISTKKTLKGLSRVTNVFIQREQEALVKSEISKAGRLRTQGQLYSQVLSDIFTLTVLKVPTLYSVFAGDETKEARHGFKYKLIGANEHEEIVKTFFGRPDPDNISKEEIRSVDEVLKIAGKELNAVNNWVHVAGQLHARKNRLISSGNGRSFIEYNPHRVRPRHIWHYRENRKENLVIVSGILQLFGHSQTPVITNASVQRFFLFYDALAGFPMRHGVKKKDDIRPRQKWRHISKRLQTHAKKEADLRTISGTLNGQQRLVTDIYRERKVAGTNSVSQAQPTTVIDFQKVVDSRRNRIQSWAIIFAHAFQQSQSKNSPAPLKDALMKLFDFVNRYLSVYTRHSLLNIRDKKPNYLDSQWPTDVTSQYFIDCGVYAVTQSFEIGRAIERSEINTSLSFQYVTFLNHICIIGYVDKYSFLINNDRIFAVRTLPNQVMSRDSQIEAARQWAERAFSDVYNVVYAVMPVVILDTVIMTSGSSADLSNRLWNNFLAATSWTVDREIAIHYHAGIVKFDSGSVYLEKLLRRVKREEKSQDIITEIFLVSITLYELADLLSDPCNFVNIKKTAAQKLLLLGVYNKTMERPRQPSDWSSYLPMYRAHDEVPRDDNYSALHTKDRGVKHLIKMQRNLEAKCKDENSKKAFINKWLSFTKKTQSFFDKINL